MLCLCQIVIGCEGDGPAIGEAISTLEEAGFHGAVVQSLIVDPLVPISITSNTRYTLQIVAPGELFFNAFLMRAEFSLPSEH